MRRPKADREGRSREAPVRREPSRRLVSALPLVAACFLLGVFVGTGIVREQEEQTDSPLRRSLRGPSAARNDANPTFPGRDAVVKAAAPTKEEAREVAQERKPPLQEEVHPSRSLRTTADGCCSAEVVAGSLDAVERVTVAAWIYLDGSDQSEDIKTVLANKGTGCDVGQNGFALAVNEWLTNDRQLTLEWGDVASGCRKLVSGERRVPYDRWTHVAATLSRDGAAALFLDGAQVAAVDAATRRDPQTTTALRIGQYPEGSFPFVGNLSAVAVVHGGAKDVVGALAQQQRPVSAAREDSYYFFALDDVPGRSKATAALRYHVRRKEGLGFGFAVGGKEEEEHEDDDAEDSETSQQRAERVKAAMRHAWAGYRAKAWGRDELKPVSGRGSDNWGGLAVTMVDSLDTLWMMGLRDEFAEAERWIGDNLRFDKAGQVSVFETTIRELGGLLAAYDLSKSDVFLRKAADLGQRLAAAFDTPTGIPVGAVHLNHAGSSSSSGGNVATHAVLAELGSLQLEFRYLAAKTGDAEFARKANRVFERMASMNPSHGLFPIFVSPSSGAPSLRSKITFGALGDSFYEYLLKTWIQGGKTEKRLRHMYDAAVDGIFAKNVVQTSSPSNLAYLADLEGDRLVHKMDHLVCFMPGVLALGAYTDPGGLQSPRATRDLDLARALLHTCVQMYERSPTKLAPEYVQFSARRDFDVAPSAPFNILRPETAESLFVLYHLTHDSTYRDWSWRIFRAFEAHCKTNLAFGSVPDVRNGPSPKVEDRMESFFLAETLKYLFLIHLDTPGFDLTRNLVFNTEAHPLAVLGPRGNHIASGLLGTAAR